MTFHDRRETGKLLAQKLKKYGGAVVFALPRGGVVTAIEIARELKAKIDLIIVRKIGHPYQREYAVGVIAESGEMVVNEEEIKFLDKRWFEKEKELQRLECKRRREKYLSRREAVDVRGKIAIIVDDGIATGLTMQMAIKEIKKREPKKIVVAIPVVPEKTLKLLKSMVDEVISLQTPGDEKFLGSISAYYEEFPQVEDAEVINLLKNYDNSLHI